MGHKMRNWARCQTWFPKKSYSPSSLEELTQIIVSAKQNHEKIRCVGSLHSFNELCVTDEIQIETDNLSKVIALDKAGLKVKVEGGIKLKALLDILAESGMTLPNQGYIINQSIAGAMATATHGSGKTGTICSYVEEIELVDGNGVLHRLTPESDEHLFSAAVVNLGCLGVIYSVTLRCIPVYKLKLSKVRGNLADTLKELPQLLKRYDNFQIALDPYSDQLFTWRYERTDDELSHRFRYRLKKWLLKGMAKLSFEFFPSPSWAMPLVLKVYMALSPFKCCVDYSQNLLSPADEGRYVEEEIAVPLEMLEEALAITRSLIKRDSDLQKRSVGVILIRFANPDPYGYLSQAAGRKTAYITLITLPRPGYLELFRDFETALYPLHGRPHWGKINILTKQRIAQLYGSNYVRFQESKRELDPNKIFSNRYIDARFD